MSVLTDNTVDLWGKDVDDLQTGVTIENGVATGTLKYVADYTSAGFDMSKGTNFLVVKADSSVPTTVTIDDRTTALDSDGILVFQMDEAKKSKSLFFVATAPNGDKHTVEIKLSGLTLATE